MIITDNLGALLTEDLFGWLKDKTMLIYLAIAFVISFVTGIVSLLVLNDFFQYLMKLMPTLVEKKVLPIEEVLNLFGTLSPVFAISSVQGIIIFVLSYFIIKRGLELAGLKGQEFSITRIIMVFILQILTSIVAILSIYRLKWLAIGFFGFVLMIIGAIFSENIIGLLLISIGIIMIIAYAIIVVINYIRLSLGTIIFIEKDRELMESLKMSWDITKGNALGILIISVAVSLIIGAFSYIVSMPSTVYLQGTMLGFTGVKDLAAFEMSFQAMIAALTSPLYIILLIPVIILSAYEIITLTYLLPLIYKLLKTKGKSGSNQETYHF